MTAIPAVFSASFGAFVLSGGPRRVRLGLCLLHFALDKFTLFFFSLLQKGRETLSLLDCDGSQCWRIRPEFQLNPRDEATAY